MMFYTLQEFLLHSKNITYILMGVAVLCLTGYWLFLSAKDEDKDLYADPRESEESGHK